MAVGRVQPSPGTSSLRPEDVEAWALTPPQGKHSPWLTDTFAAHLLPWASLWPRRKFGFQAAQKVKGATPPGRYPNHQARASWFPDDPERCPPPLPSSKLGWGNPSLWPSQETSLSFCLAFIASAGFQEGWLKTAVPSVLPGLTWVSGAPKRPNQNCRPFRGHMAPTSPSRSQLSRPWCYSLGPASHDYPPSCLWRGPQAWAAQGHLFPLGTLGAEPQPWTCRNTAKLPYNRLWPLSLELPTTGHH